MEAHFDAESRGLRESARAAVEALLAYCARENWAGYDPYDALNSRLFGASPFSRSKIARLVFTQGMKRLPINLRPVLLVPKEENPKACALFCSGLMRLTSCGILEDDGVAAAMVERLVELRSQGRPYYCWGYNFDWQNRGSLVPKYSPNIICTTFAGNALLDAFERDRRQDRMTAAVSAGEFLIKGLNTTIASDGICLSYTPLDRSQIHNANLLGAAFIGRLSELTGRKDFRDVALRATMFSLHRQSPDGSWPYGEEKEQAWIDNFHTGYNLVALRKLADVLHDGTVTESLERGLDYYVNHLFCADGVPKYFSDRRWPIDIHCVAQSIITLCELAPLFRGAMPLARKLCLWALENMQSSGGYFYYQRTRFFTNRIPYMRWSQAWMLNALAAILSSLP